MTDALAKFGITADDLETQFPEYDMVPIVQDRVAHIDADFICYEVACTTVAMQDKIDAGTAVPRTLQQLKDGLVEVIKRRARMVGATNWVAHVTPAASTKGGREDDAVTKPYQGNRKDVEKPEHLDALRGFLGEQKWGIPHLDQEADDGMTQANYAAILAGKPDLSVIVSRDKDLRMAPGWQWDFTYEKLVWVPVVEVGQIELEQHETGNIDAKTGKKKLSAKKLLGHGTLFFWAQCLMGDTVDNIAGLPLVSGDFLFNRGIGKAGQKPRMCGAVVAYALLKDIETNKDAFTLVAQAFRTSPAKFLDWRTQEPTTGMKALGGDMKLLWMRRTKSRDDLAQWLLKEMQ